jgi:alpha-N-acetylglucosamine transferase
MHLNMSCKTPRWSTKFAMGYPFRAIQRPLRSKRLLQAILILASLFVFIYYHVLNPETVPNLPIHKHIGSGSSRGSKVAFSTLLTRSGAEYMGEMENDFYFQSIRLLNYQLQHANNTRSTREIPFVLATTDVSLWKRDKLEQEGATVTVVEKLGSSWLQPLTDRWKDIMAKLRLWELVQYDRILFLDADTFLLKLMDGIFNDPAAQHRKSVENSDEPSLPSNYVLASHSEILHTTHTYPPPEWPTFNGGFFLMSPSLQMCHYLTSLLNIPERFDSTYMEQSLLNYAHREPGNMPWTRLNWKWNVNLPNMNDVKEGVHSVHAKLWSPGSELQPVEMELRELWQMARVEMDMYYKEHPPRRV